LEFARNPDTELHKYFEWNNDEAAEKFRLAQARALIRVAVIVEPRSSERVRAYVSLTSDRHNEGGYRAITEIINDDVLVDTLLQDALKELAAFQRKYNHLKTIAELSGVFESIEKVVDKTAPSEEG